MPLNYTLIYLKLIEEVAQDGELNHKEIKQLAKWLNDNEDGRKTWPASQFFPLLKDVFADGKIERPEAERVGRLIQKVRREWAREHALAGSKLDQTMLDNLITKFDLGQAKLPVIENQIEVSSSLGEPDLLGDSESSSEFDSVYQVDFSTPSCNCPDFKSNRQQLPVGHISRCCEHIIQGYSQVRPNEGWPSWLDSFLEAGFRPLPNQSWAVVESEKGNYLVSSAAPDWGNVYAKIDGEDVKHSYHVSEKRWAYDNVPDDAKTLAETINRLTKG